MRDRARLGGLAEHPHCAGQGMQQTKNKFEDRGFAAAIRAHDGHEFALQDVEIHVAKHRVAVKSESDSGHGHGQ